MTSKISAEGNNVLKWLLGAGLLGAGLRTGYHLMGNNSSTPGYKAEDDLYQPEVELPVEMTPEQYKRYQGIVGQYAKSASAWGPTLKTLALAGGGVGGWVLAGKAFRAARKAKVERELQKVRDELSALAEPLPAQIKEVKDFKVAAAWDWLEIMAEGMTKEASIGKMVSGAKALAGKTLGTIKENPLETAAVGVGGLATVGAGLPLVSGAANIAGSTAQAVTGGVGRMVGSPIGSTVLKILGPIAALSLLYGMSRGYQASQGNPGATNRQKIDALRKKVRETESQQQPFFRLQPRVVEPEPRTVRHEPQRLNLTQTYRDADEEQK